MSGFDFRDMLGGMGMAVENDPALADGIDRDVREANIDQEAERANALAQVMATWIATNTQVNRVSLGATLGMSIAFLSHAFRNQFSTEHQAEFHRVIRSALDSIEAGTM